MRLLLLLALTSCTAAQARRAHTAGEVSLAGSLVGILGCVAAAEIVPSHDNEILDAGIVFVPIAVLGALTYIATDGMVNAPKEHVLTAEERNWDTAYDLARQAKHAARANDCAEVQAIQPRVRELSDDVYRRFLRDKIIQTCLAPQVDP